MPLNLLTWLLSLLPLVVVMVLMLGFRASGKRASAAGWVSAVLVSLLAFGGTWKVLAYAQVKALWMSLDVLYIVWGALLLSITWCMKLALSKQLALGSPAFLEIRLFKY